MKKSLKINFMMNMLLTISSLIFPLITFPYVSRILSPEGIGKVSFATSLINYFSMFAQLGIPTYGIRICAQVRDNREKLSRVVQELLSINIITSLISYIGLFIAVFTVPKLQNDKALYFIMSVTIILSSIGMEWLYKALEEYTYITVRSVVFKFIALLAMFLLIHKQTDYILYGGISILAASASNVLNFINIHKYVDLKSVRNNNLKMHIKPICVFFAMSFATTIYTNLDTVMLGFMTTNIDVGYYNAAIKIKGILVSIITSLGTVLLPRASYYIEMGLEKELVRISKKTLSFTILLACPLVIYFILFAKETIIFLSGSSFEGAIFPMQILMPTILIIGISNILGMEILVPMNKEKIVLYSVVIGATINIVINMVLIPDLKSSGAAVGTVCAECGVLLIQSFALKKYFVTLFKDITYHNIIIALLMGVVSSIWLKNINIHIVTTLFFSAILFFGVYSGYLLFKREEIIVEIWNGIKKKLREIL